MTKRNSKKLQGRGRTGWRSRSRKKHVIVSPMCPREMMLRRIGPTVQAIDALLLPSSVDKFTVYMLLIKRIYT